MERGFRCAHPPRANGWEDAKAHHPGIPQGLLNYVFFHNVKNFCLKEGQEHRDLKLSQVKQEVVIIEGRHCARYTYTKHGSKNRQKGLKQLHLDNKIVPQYETLESKEQCHVEILDIYLLKLPPGALQLDAFYLRPLQKPVDPSKPWYSLQPLGRNTLAENDAENVQRSRITWKYH